MEWAADAYVQARDFGVKGLDFKPEDDLIYGLDGKLIVMIPKLPETYRELAKNIAEIQIYKAGIRLADMLNAIYDPEEAKPAYDKFVISLNGETLNELCPVNIQFMDKVYSV
jgi:hypothetical protein